VVSTYLHLSGEITMGLCFPETLTLVFKHSVFPIALLVALERPAPNGGSGREHHASSQVFGVVGGKTALQESCSDLCFLSLKGRQYYDGL